MELLRALAALSEPPTAESGRLADLVGLGEAPDDVEWTELFALQLPPYASIYLSADGRLGGEARDRVAGFWRALGLVPPPEPDHLPVLLAFQAELGDRAAAASDDERQRWLSAARAFLHEHLTSWAPFYLASCSAIGAPFYRRWTELLAAALADETARLGALAAAPAALRETVALALPVDGPAGEGWLDALLAPAASGVFLPRAVLAGVAGELALGERLGERRITLRTLLAQDAAATLARLAVEARRAVASHRAAGAASPAIADWWSNRAARSAAILDRLAAEARSSA